MRRRETTPTRAKVASLATLRCDLGKDKIGHRDRHKLIEYRRKRADQIAEPVTLAIEIAILKTGIPWQVPPDEETQLLASMFERQGASSPNQSKRRVASLKLSNSSGIRI